MSDERPVIYLRAGPAAGNCEAGPLGQTDTVLE